MLVSVFRGRLHRDEWFPASHEQLTARTILLRTGECVRVVEGGVVSHPPVVFIHGWGASAYYFRHLLYPVMAGGHRVIALDLRGHGGSDKPVDRKLYSGDSMAQHVEEVLDHLEIERVALVAHSLGGGVALDVASRRPANLSSLTLLAPVGLAPVRFVRLARMATPAAASGLVQYAVPPWTVPVALRAVNGTLGDFSMRDVDEYSAPSGDPSFGPALHALLHGYRFEARSDKELDNITCPVEVLLGGQDLLVRSRASAQRAQSMRQARAHVVERAGHVLAEEVPDRVLEVLLPLLAASR